MRKFTAMQGMQCSLIYKTSGNRMFPKHENKKNKVFASGCEAQQELCLNCGISEKPCQDDGAFPYPALIQSAFRQFMAAAQSL
ncbi:hypothetical protein BEN74_11005 [Acinetobacter sp. WCHAc010034]|nr:hypothetical protein BEN74_11005 [Acinetobacter sp. WCHAc010034]